MKLRRVSDDEIFCPRTGETAEDVTFRVLSCVAALRDVDIADLPPLAYTVDPDAMNALFPPTRDARCSLTLEFAGTHVTLCQNGDIRAYLLPDRL